jgi:hypothetical protein
MPPPPPTSILASERYLRRQPWWPAYERRRAGAAKLSDFLFLGHFCLWLDQHQLRPATCTPADLQAYAASVRGFRDEVRGGYVRAASELVAMSWPEDA